MRKRKREVVGSMQRGGMKSEEVITNVRALTGKGVEGSLLLMYVRTYIRTYVCECTTFKELFNGLHIKLTHKVGALS